MNTPVPHVDSVIWRAAIGDLTGTRFGELTEPDLILEGSIFAHSIVGVEAVHRVLRMLADTYDELRITHETVTPQRTVMEFEGIALSLHVSAVAVLALSGQGRVRHVGIYHRPLGAVLRISAEFSDRLTTSTNGRRSS